MAGVAFYIEVPNYETRYSGRQSKGAAIMNTTCARTLLRTRSEPGILTDSQVKSRNRSRSRSRSRGHSRGRSRGHSQERNLVANFNETSKEVIGIEDEEKLREISERTPRSNVMERYDIEEPQERAHKITREEIKKSNQHCRDLKDYLGEKSIKRRRSSRDHSRDKSRGRSRGRSRGHSRGRSRGHSRGRSRGHSRGRSRGDSRGKSRGRSRSRSYFREKDLNSVLIENPMKSHFNSFLNPI